MTIDSLSPEDFESTEPNTAEVVSRGDGQAYRIEAHTITGGAASPARAYTYAQTAGMYRVGPDSNGIVEAFDELFAEIESLRGVVGGINRLPGDGYEVCIEVVDEPRDTVVEDASRTSAVYTISAEDDLADDVDEALGALADRVSE